MYDDFVITYNLYLVITWNCKDAVHEMCTWVMGDNVALIGHMPYTCSHGSSNWFMTDR